MNSFYEEKKAYRPINKPVFWITRPGRYIVRKIKWYLFWKPVNWLAKKAYQARRNRFVQAIAFIPIALGYLSIVGTFAYYQFGWRFPELFASEVVQIEVQKEIQQDRLTQATKDLNEAEA